MDTFLNSENKPVIPQELNQGCGCMTYVGFEFKKKRKCCKKYKTGKNCKGCPKL